jgi:transcription-repair coupling factor (superfamily II helicase)
MGMRSVVYPYREFTFRNMESHSREYERQRLSALAEIQRGTADAIVCCVDAALQWTLPPQELRQRTVEVRAGAALSPEQLVRALVSAGYERADLVEGEGQFTRRGGIVDFYAPGSFAPVRVEFWGDEIDSAGYFDPDTQRRTDAVDVMRLTPAVLKRSATSLAPIETRGLSLRS